MPQVSIIIPTYNRADTILRAIDSVLAQTFTDWELIIINDGSTDNTEALLTGLDGRVKVIHQPNGGVTVARNTGLRHATGDFFAFLDSDDQWRSYHLELCLSFLNAHPQAKLVSCELHEDFGNGRVLTHYQVELSHWYLHTARLIGSKLLDLPAGENDCYLRVYNQRHPMGEWGQPILQRWKITDSAHYEGDIFQSWRWGFLMWLPTTVLRREVVEKIGEFSSRYPICSDFDWMAEACRHYKMHFLSVPTGIKHDLAVGGKKLAEGHIAKDKTASVAALDMLHHLENNYCHLDPEDAELAALRSHKQHYLAQVQLARGLRGEALFYLKQAWKNSPEKGRVARLWLLAALVPHARLCQQIYSALRRVAYSAGMISRGELSLFRLLAKLPRKLLRLDKEPNLQRA
ncbi:MAG: glycosyltransferase family 2 protein [Acidobacteria bacterium]|nr:glycosyltransferase family 2 protein [Acidobacteriota bacterium]